MLIEVLTYLLTYYFHIMFIAIRENMYLVENINAYLIVECVGEESGKK